MKYLIVNGDDFGASAGISRGILEAHHQGVLTSTSFMVNTAASEAAAALARAALGPASVGLHADLTAEMRASSPRLEQRVAATLENQLLRFEQLMGRAPTHLDSHHNLHRDPRALPVFLELARRLGVPLRDYSPLRYFSGFYGQWGGVTHGEQIRVENLMKLLQTEVRDGITELSCHPGYVEPDFVTSYAAEREMEVRTLCDPAIRQALAEQEIQLVNYHDVAGLLSLEIGATSSCRP